MPATELQLDHVDAGGVRVDAPARRARSTTTPRCATCVEADTAAVCIVAKSSDVPRDRGAADHARRGRGDDRRLGGVPARRTGAGCSSTWSTSSTATSATRSSRCGRSRRRSSTVPPTSCCATPTAARCRTRSSRSSPTSTATSATTSSSASTATTTPGAPSPTRWPRSRPAPATCRARSTGSASAPATPTSPRSSPTSQLKLGYRCLPEGRIERLTAVSHHVAEVLNRAVNPQAPYVGVVGVRPQGRPARAARSSGPRTPTSTSTRSWSATARASSSVEMAGRATIQMKADELGLADGRPGRQRR